VAKRVDERTVIADRHFELLRLGGNVYIYRAGG
jgi:hypothetical protein